MYLQGSPKEATEVQGHLEDPAKVLFLLHLGIRAAGRIVKNFPDERNKYLSSCYRVYLPIGIVPGVDIIGYSVPKRLCPCFVESRGAKNLAIGNRG